MNKNNYCQWIKLLPPGQYTIQDLKNFTGLVSGDSIRIIMLKYGAEVKSIKVPGRKVLKDVFIWKGFQESKSKFQVEAEALIEKAKKLMQKERRRKA